VCVRVCMCDCLCMCACVQFGGDQQGTEAENGVCVCVRVRVCARAPWEGGVHCFWGVCMVLGVTRVSINTFEGGQQALLGIVCLFVHVRVLNWGFHCFFGGGWGV